MKNMLRVMAVFIISLLTVSMVSALDANDLTWGTVRVNGDIVEDGDVLAVEEGQTLDVRVGLEAVNGADDIEVEAKIGGYEYSDFDRLDDSTGLFDIQAGNTKYVNLEVTLPTKLEKDEYWLRLRVLDRNTEALEQVIQLSVEPTRHGVDIKDVVFSPGSTVKAGRSLLTTVLLENFGDKDEDDVKVTVSLPELGVSATEFVDVLETDDHNIEREDVPEMFLPIPANAEAGEYRLVVQVQYDDLRETIAKAFTISVLGNELFQQDTGKLVLAVGPEMQTVAAGSTAKYGVALQNAGMTSKAYTIQAVTGNWATAMVSESLVVLEPGQSKVVYVDVAASQDATAGEHIVSVTVKSGNEALQTVSLKANVVPGNGDSNVNLRNGLEIALIILVVLLVIIGLIVGFSRLRKDDDEDQSYY